MMGSDLRCELCGSAAADIDPAFDLGAHLRDSGGSWMAASWTCTQGHSRCQFVDRDGRPITQKGIEDILSRLPRAEDT